jgi:hypothetical protein
MMATKQAHSQPRTSSSHFTNKRYISLPLLLALLSLSGCGESDPPKVQVFPVAGKVKLASGEVPVGARIVLHAVTRSEAIPAGISPTGTVKKDGTFKISVYGEEDGAPPGEYKATVEWFKPVVTKEESFQGPNVLPANYSDPARTPVSVTVQAGPTEVPPIEIALKKKS